MNKTFNPGRRRGMMNEALTMMLLVFLGGVLGFSASGCGPDAEDGAGTGEGPSPAAQSSGKLVPRDDLIPVGAPAPDFTARDQEGTPVALSELLKTHQVVLIFYPADNTPVCTKQLCAVRDDWSKFQEKGATVLGINPAGVSKHAQFAKKHSFPFPVLSDEDSRIAKAYGAGGTIFVQRTVYVLGRNGKVALADRGVVSHDRILAALDAS
jgi:peroxiredoxin Q/BCP